MEVFEIKTETNFDYILAVKSQEEGFEMVQIPIKRSTRILEELKTIYLDPQQNAADMHFRVKSLVPNIGELPFCLNHEYHDSYISDIKYPDFDTWEYRNRIESLINSKIKSRMWGIKKNSDNYAEEYAKCESKVREEIVHKLTRDKKEYLKISIPYIYAFDYQKTLEEYNISDDYYLYSNEIHGRFSYSHDLTEDFKVKVNTNFCYGSASYFNIIVTYKGIDILPYSTWVKYYYAGYNELLRFTRCYRNYRSNWASCMNFLTNYVNSAILNPKDFIHKDILEEINGLLKGLEHIFVMNDAAFKALLKVNHIPEDDDRYIGISAGRHATRQDIERYKIRPEECAMIYKMEKICGALHFLENLQKLKEIDVEIETVINRIKEMNRSIYPDVLNAMPPIQAEIDDLNKDLDPINKLLKNKESQLERLEKSLASRLSYARSEDKKKSIKESFIKNHPEYTETKEKIFELWGKASNIEIKIRDRENVLKRLKEFKHLIESHAQSI